MPKAALEGLRRWRAAHWKKKSEKSEVKEVVRKVPRRRSWRRRFRRRPSQTVALAPVAGVAAGIIPVAMQAIGGDMQGAAKALLKSYSGIDIDSGSWNPMAATGLVALVEGTIIHIAASKIGVNRALGRAHVPLIRV